MALGQTHVARCTGCLMVIVDVRLLEAEGALEMADKLFGESRLAYISPLLSFSNVKLSEARELASHLSYIDGADPDVVVELLFSVGDLLHRVEKLGVVTSAMSDELCVRGVSRGSENVAVLLNMRSGYDASFGAGAIMRLIERVQKGLSVDEVEDCYWRGVAALAFSVESSRHAYAKFPSARAGCQVDSMGVYPGFDKEMKERVKLYRDAVSSVQLPKQGVVDFFDWQE